jgi:hypothetical protein
MTSETVGSTCFLQQDGLTKDAADPEKRGLHASG